MSKYETDVTTEEKLKAEAEEFTKTSEFELEKQDVLYRLQREGKDEPDEETLNKLAKESYIEVRRREIYCEKNGHSWKETNPDPENGTSDLDCECCGEHHTLHW